MPSEYEAAHLKYRELAKKATQGDVQAMKDKAKAAQDVRQIEREAARAGTILSAVYQGDKVKVNTAETNPKRSMQEEYIRKFDPEKTVMIDGKEQTLREYHTKRLLKK